MGSLVHGRACSSESSLSSDQLGKLGREMSRCELRQEYREVKIEIQTKRERDLKRDKESMRKRR